MKLAIEEATEQMKKSGIHYLVVKSVRQQKIPFQNVMAGFPTKEAAENYIQEHHKIPRLRNEQ